MQSTNICNNNDLIRLLLNSNQPELVRNFLFTNKDLVQEHLSLSAEGYIEVFNVYGLDILSLLSDQETKYFFDAIHFVNNSQINMKFWNLISEAIECS